MPRTYLLRIAREAIAIEQEQARDAGTLGYTARLLVQATTPHKDPGQDVYCFERSNGSFRLVMMAHPRVGLPWGGYPRMLLCWLTSEAVRTRSPRLELGSSLYAFMRQLGQIPAGGRWGTIARLRDQARRLFSTTIRCSYDGPGRFEGAGFSIASRFSLRWNPAAPDQLDLFGSYVELSQDFFRDIIERPVPVDLRVLRALRSPLALDIYCWLTCRASDLREPTEIPWPTLALQFGAAYADPRRFRDSFLRQVTGNPATLSGGQRLGGRAWARLFPRRSLGEMRAAMISPLTLTNAMSSGAATS